MAAGGKINLKLEERVGRRLLLFPKRVSLGDTSAMGTSKHILSWDIPYRLNTHFFDCICQNEKRQSVVFPIIKNVNVLVNVSLHLHETQNDLNGLKMTVLKYSDMWRCHLA